MGDSNVEGSSGSSHQEVSVSDYSEDTLFPCSYEHMKESIHNFEIRDDDIWVCSFPKSGTMWTAEMVWCIANDLDFKRAEIDILTRFSWLEGIGMFNPEDTNLLPLRRLEHTEQSPSPRFIISHLPYHLLPRQLTEGKTNAKIVYVCRNPKDVCISTYHFTQCIRGYNGTFENICDNFLSDKINYGPYWKHVIEFWERKNSNNILFIKYEHMKKDLRHVINQIAIFLNKSLSEDQVRLLEDHLSFDKMKSNPAVNHEKMLQEYTDNKPWGKNRVFEKFMRKGEADQWKTELSADLIKRFDNWTNINLVKHPELKCEFS